MSRATWLRAGAVLLAWLHTVAFLPPLAGDGAREARGDDARRLSIARARAEGAGGGHPTLRAGAPGAHALVLLVDFPDTTWSEPELHTPGYYDSLLFATTTPSVRTYYEEISRGAFTLTGDVHPVSRAPATIVTYTGDGQCPGCCCGTAPYPHSSQKLVEDVVASVDPAIDFSRYDGDGDGVVDVLFVVHAGIDVADRPVPRQFASHQWHTVQTPVPDGVRVEGYALVAEYSGIGAFAHEMAHLFGVPDLWDLTCCSAGLGDWSLMATGARLGTPRYANPAHPDPWTKAQLGFVASEVPDLPGGAGAVTLAPVATGGQVLRLPVGGRPGPEYFLVENRRRDAGAFDRALPGEGVLVYHVDERVPLNTDPPRYKVALEQADGRFDLEFPTFFDLFGDAGDPFPGDSARTAFDDATRPSANAYDGTPSGVSLSEISLGPGDATLHVSLAPGPVHAAALRLAEEAAGDGDVRPEAGERWSLSLFVSNTGRDGTQPVEIAATAARGASVSPASITLPAIGSGSVESNARAFEIAFPDTLSENPVAVPVTLVMTAGTARDTSIVSLVAGDGFGLTTRSFEMGLEGFTHASLSPGGEDPWHLSTRRAASGDVSLACAGGDAGEPYPDDVDAALTSPPLLLGAASELHLAYWIDAESQPPRDALDGARVEVSLDGTHFEVVEPLGGYTHEPLTNAAFPLFTSEVYSGRSILDPTCDDGWCGARFDISRFDGSAAWIRVRFGSDGQVGGEGVFVDDVRVETIDDPVAFHIFETIVEDDDYVPITFTVVENFEAYSARMRLVRERVDADGEPVDPEVALFSGTVSGTFRTERLDQPMVRGERRRYRLLERGEEGAPDVLRAERFITRAALPAAPALVAAGPTPFVASASAFRIELRASRRSPIAVDFFDAAGRRIARRVGRVNGAVEIVEWDGSRGDGGRAPAGVYFFRAPGGIRGRTVLLR